MKQFIIINGTSAHIVKRETLRLAIDSAQNTCDFSKEVIVRELDDDSVNAIIEKELLAYDEHIKHVTHKGMRDKNSEREVNHYIKYYKK